MTIILWIDMVIVTLTSTVKKYSFSSTNETDHARWLRLISPDLVMMWQSGNFEYLSITLPFSAIQLNINPFRFQNFLSGTEMQ